MADDATETDITSPDMMPKTIYIYIEYTCVYVFRMSQNPQ